MGFSSTIEGGSNGKSDRNAKCRRWWLCQCEGRIESFIDNNIKYFFIKSHHQPSHIICCFFFDNFYVMSYLFLDLL